MTLSLKCSGSTSYNHCAKLCCLTVLRTTVVAVVVVVATAAAVVIPQCRPCIWAVAPPWRVEAKSYRIQRRNCILWHWRYDPNADVASICWPSSPAVDNTRWSRQSSASSQWTPASLSSLSATSYTCITTQLSSTSAWPPYDIHTALSIYCFTATHECKW